MRCGNRCLLEEATIQLPHTWCVIYSSAEKVDRCPFLVHLPKDAKAVISMARTANITVNRKNSIDRLLAT